MTDELLQLKYQSSIKNSHRAKRGKIRYAKEKWYEKIYWQENKENKKDTFN